jgi:hypothetical protein
MPHPKLKAAGGLIFWDAGERYRIRFRLSDGRFVYATEGAQFKTLTKEELGVGPWLEDAVCRCGFSTDLLRFEARAVFERAQQPFLTIAETIPELVESPVDFTVFVLGGISAGEFISRHGDSFQA